MELPAYSLLSAHVKSQNLCLWVKVRSHRNSIAIHLNEDGSMRYLLLVANWSHFTKPHKEFSLNWTSPVSSQYDRKGGIDAEFSKRIHILFTSLYSEKLQVSEKKRCCFSACPRTIIQVHDKVWPRFLSSWGTIQKNISAGLKHTLIIN